MSSSTPVSEDIFAKADRLCPWKASKGPLAVFPAFDPKTRTFTDHGMSIEYNHDVPMRDGVRLRADIFRPAKAAASSAKLPVVLAITPYGKQNPFDVSSIPPSRDFDPGFDGVSFSKYAVFEGSDPVFWTRQGFAYVAVDARGSYASEGDKANLCSKADGVDAFDAIEYLASCEWSNGRVGMIGASALGAIQWQAAALRPPHLSGIIVQDAFTDMYREIAFKGGVPHLAFMALLDDMYRPHGNTQGAQILHCLRACEEHPYDDEFWELFAPEIDNITCPMYIVSSLADNGLHTQGTIRGWLAAKSEVKYLELHPLHVADKRYAGSWRSEETYPLARTVRTKYHLDLNGKLLIQPDESGKADESIQYDATTGSCSWDVTFSEPTEITGSAKLQLRFAIAGDGAEDADIFVTLQKLDREGHTVVFPYHTFINDGHVAYGWLRASKRALASTAYGDEVAYTFAEKDVQYLHPNVPVDLSINIQPSATLFRKGETLRLAVQGRDFGEYGPASQIPRAGTGCNKAGQQHTIFLRESYLEVPIIPRDV